MKKNFIKLNNNEKHLSLGNLFRIIKEISTNKTSALQSEIFCALFEIETINDTTVNNYCVGCRGIGSEYKQIMLTKIKKYQKNNEEFANNIINLLSIIDGNVYVIKTNKIEFINNNSAMLYLSNKLYNIAKNDKEVNTSFINKLKELISTKNYYDCLIQIFQFIVLTKRQPVYEEELKIEVIETILNDTSISSISLQEYLSLKLREGINYDFSLKKIGDKGNAYANFELGCNEYYGYQKGIPRYDVAYEYFVKAAELNHAGANYMLGNMYLKGLIGSKSNEELEKAYNYLLKAHELGNIAACNTIGNMYLNGIYPLVKNLDKAIEFYEIGVKNNYAYSYNNLGKISEDKKDNKKALAYFLESANLGESWACNKVGEYYRLGLIEQDMQKAFEYYKKATDSNFRTLCYYSYYNLAKYFYLNGYDNIVLTSNQNKAVEYFKLASSNNILEATVELFYISIKKYLVNKKESTYKEIMKYKKIIEENPKYDENLRITIENNIESLKNKKEINLDV